MPTLASILSIVDREPVEIREAALRNVIPISQGVICKANWRHSFTGAVYVRVIQEVKYWVAVLECGCGTWRTTRYTPNTGQQVGAHRYWRPANSDYPDDLSQDECRAIWLASMLASEESAGKTNGNVTRQ